MMEKKKREKESDGDTEQILKLIKSGKKLETIEQILHWVVIARNVSLRERDNALADSNNIGFAYHQGAADLCYDLITAITTGVRVEQKVEKTEGYV